MKNGEDIEIRLMSDTHLKNTINLFEPRGFDVSPLKNELRYREIIRNPI